MFKTAFAAVMIAAAAALPAKAQMGDMMMQNLMFDQQFNNFVNNGINTMLQQCAQARAMGLLTNGGCFDGYDPRTFSDSNTGGDAITGGYWDRQQMMDGAAKNYTDGLLGIQDYYDQFGNPYQGTGMGDSGWVDDQGQLYEMPGFVPPNYLQNFQQVFPMMPF
jgi:hypothetical protein